jgi:hypothetical protein
VAPVKQVIWLDDSGDAGFKFKRGSTRYFVIACIIFDDPLDSEFANVGIRMYRRSLGWKDTHEFKFNKTRKDERLAFLKEVQKYNFKIRAVVVDKTKVTDTRLKTSKQSFYLAIVKDVLVHFGDRMDDAKIYLDGQNIKGYTQKMRTFLRQALNTDKLRMRKFSTADSIKEVLVQLADMVAGSLNRSYQESKTDKDEYRALIESKIEDIWECS